MHKFKHRDIIQFKTLHMKLKISNNMFKICHIFFFIKKRVCAIFVFLIVLTILRTYFGLQSMNERLKDKLPPHLQKYLIRHNIETNNIDVGKLKRTLDKLNSMQKITNINRYRYIENEFPILIIQVHKGLENLQYLIISLAQVEGIDTCLLVFSHSFYSNTINNLVQSIDFCQVLQIFYPFSLQLNPYTFPGVDPEDCILNKQNTTNSKSFCAKRNATFIEHKQHWWWKANFVFDRLRLSRQHMGHVIFLEENNYVAPSLLLMFKYALKSFSFFPHTEVLSFGRPFKKNCEMDLLSVEPWQPLFDVGLAFNRTIWKRMLAFSGHYCMYDDSSWSYSLLNLFRRFPRAYASMVACVTPRVLSTKQFVNINKYYRTYSHIYTIIDKYPKKVKAVFLYGPDGVIEALPKSPLISNGGWSDLRDQMLCLDPLMSTTTE